MQSVVLFRTVDHLVGSHERFAIQVTNAINDLLLVIILMELLRTVIAPPRSRGLPPQAVPDHRHHLRRAPILGVGAQLTLAGEGTEVHLRRAQIELGVRAAVVLALALSFFPDRP